MGIMKTFEQYINETRQKYIFGGTDDRNTEIAKTFAELKPGDKFYWFYKRKENKTGVAKCYTLTGTSEYDGDIKLYSKHHYDYVCITKDQYESSIFTDEMHGVQYVASTNYDLFIDTVEKEIGIALKETDIEIVQ